MRYFTQEWYQAGCRKIDEYNDYFNTIANQLPAFFRDGYSLHDARVKGWHIYEPYWGRKDLVIDLDTHQSYAKVKKLVFMNCEIEAPIDFSAHWWIADEIFVDSDRFSLNVLLLNDENDFCEINIRFASFESCC